MLKNVPKYLHCSQPALCIFALDAHTVIIGNVKVLHGHKYTLPHSQFCAKTSKSLRRFPDSCPPTTAHRSLATTIKSPKTRGFEIITREIETNTLPMADEFPDFSECFGQKWWRLIRSLVTVIFSNLIQCYAAALT